MGNVTDDSAQEGRGASRWENTSRQSPSPRRCLSRGAGPHLPVQTLWGALLGEGWCWLPPRREQSDARLSCPRGRQGAHGPWQRSRRGWREGVHPGIAKGPVGTPIWITLFDPSGSARRYLCRVSSFISTRHNYTTATQQLVYTALSMGQARS